MFTTDDTDWADGSKIGKKERIWLRGSPPRYAKRVPLSHLAENRASAISSQRSALEQEFFTA